RLGRARGRRLPILIPMRHVERAALESESAWTVAPAPYRWPVPPRRRSRHVEASAVAAIGLVVRLVCDVGFWWFAGGYALAAVLLFVRPIQALVLTPLFGARRPTPTE